jgi:uncharacterized membrane protein (TIGR02234 family)
VSGRRGFAAVLLVTLVGAGLLVLVAGRVWVTVRVGPARLPGAQLTATGGDLSAVPEACGFLGLAGVAGLVATRRIGRRVVGSVLAVAGAGAVAAVGSVLTGLRPAVAALASTHPGGFPLGHVPLSPNAWPALAILGGVLLAVGGGLATWLGPRWAGLSARYRAEGARTATAPGRPEDGDVAAWDALDRGEDPTTAARGG